MAAKILCVRVQYWGDNMTTPYRKHGHYYHESKGKKRHCDPIFKCPLLNSSGFHVCKPIGFWVCNGAWATELISIISEK